MAMDGPVAFFTDHQAFALAFALTVYGLAFDDLERLADVNVAVHLAEPDGAQGYLYRVRPTGPFADYIEWDDAWLSDSTSIPAVYVTEAPLAITGKMPVTFCGCGLRELFM
jgi:hypothetical protein